MSLRVTFAFIVSWFVVAGAAWAGSDKTSEALTKVEEQADPAADIDALEASVPPAKPEDVRSIDDIMVAIYASISGPAGPRDWNRLRSLMLPKVRLTESILDERGRSTDG